MIWNENTVLSHHFLLASLRLCVRLWEDINIYYYLIKLCCVFVLCLHFKHESIELHAESVIWTRVWEFVCFCLSVSVASDSQPPLEGKREEGRDHWASSDRGEVLIFFFLDLNTRLLIFNIYK